MSQGRSLNIGGVDPWGLNSSKEIHPHSNSTRRQKVDEERLSVIHVLFSECGVAVFQELETSCGEGQWKRPCIGRTRGGG